MATSSLPSAAGDRPQNSEHRARNRRQALRVLQVTAVALVALIAFGIVAIMVFSRTDWGRERVRRFIVSQLSGKVHGQITLGRIRGNLLNGATIDAFAIRDSAGQPFFAAEQVRARYSILQLLTRKIDLRDVHLVRPLIVLDRPTGGKWNYQRIFQIGRASCRERV